MLRGFQQLLKALGVIDHVGCQHLVIAAGCVGEVSLGEGSDLMGVDQPLVFHRRLKVKFDNGTRRSVAVTQTSGEEVTTPMLCPHPVKMIFQKLTETLQIWHIHFFGTKNEPIRLWWTNVKVPRNY